jgi:hypothetical protein
VAASAPAASSNDWYTGNTTAATNTAASNPYYSNNVNANATTASHQQQHQQQQPLLSGSMDSSAPSNINAAAPTIMQPQQFMPSQAQRTTSTDSELSLDKPPLLEELGINLEHILVKTSRLFELGCGLREQRYLIAYPIALLYSAFVLIMHIRIQSNKTTYYIILILIKYATILQYNTKDGNDCSGSDTTLWEYSKSFTIWESWKFLVSLSSRCPVAHP